ncbi:RNA polymerase subunit sigma-70 [Nocardiopsis sp. NPDC049922]|uniref:RNA polymerase subunit sigma-70 n=1 Tax=Nocardiopsis sp. NPDC049922 TaxID=3155157 RepID=UPI0033F60E64
MTRPVDFRLTHLVPALDDTCDGLVAEALDHPSLPEERWWSRIRLPLVLGRVGAEHVASGLARLASPRWEGRALGEVMPALYATGRSDEWGAGLAEQGPVLDTPLWRLTSGLDETSAGRTLRAAFLTVLETLPREPGGNDVPRAAEEDGTVGAQNADTPATGSEPPRETRAPEQSDSLGEDRPSSDPAASSEPAVAPAVTGETDHAATLLDEIHSWFMVGDERRRAVAARRIFTDAPETLESISGDFGVTRERIRQIHKQVERDLRSWLDSPFGEPLTAYLESVSARLGSAAPLDSFWALCPEHPLPVPCLGIPMGRVVLTLLPRHRVTDGWLLTEEADAFARRLSGLLETRTCLPLGETLEAAHGAGILPEHARAWIETLPRTGVVDDQVIHWGRSLPDKACAVLAAAGRPLHIDELIERLGADFNEAGFRERLHNDDRLMRRDRRVFGLRSWGGEEYLGVEGTVRRELEMAGGEMRVAELAESIAGRFDVSESSVRSLTSGSAFAHPRPGWIGLLDDPGRGGDSAYRPRRTVDRTRRCFRDAEGAWWLRVDVNAEHLRGSGFPMPNGFAVWAGLYPGARVPMLVGDRESAATWKNQPLMSSVRPLLQEQGAAEGDHAFITFAGGRVRCRVSPAASASPDPLSRALNLAGVTAPVSGTAAVAVLADALGLASDTSADRVRERLADRGDHDILEALDTLAQRG